MSEQRLSTPLAFVELENEKNEKYEKHEKHEKHEKPEKLEKHVDAEKHKINEALFRPSEWDDYPLKRDDKHTNKIVQPDFAPFCDADNAEPLPDGFEFLN